MAKYLVIVESPAKAHTLKKFLGSDYAVEACAGHIRDLPPKTLGVDVDKDFKPTYQTIKGKDKTIKNLEAKAKKMKVIYLAPDPDREGEAIAWHLAYYLKLKDKKVPIKRIEFNEITKKAVQEALLHPRDIDIRRVDAQQARRILDRLVGYKISPLLWRNVMRGLSAGRVQSVAVRLIVDRELEIERFKPEEYWSLTAHFDGKTPFEAKLFAHRGEKIKLENKSAADKVLSDLDGAYYIVSDILKKEQKRNPYPPFITSTLQQEASRKFGFPTKKTMMIAQQLYEGVDLAEGESVGLITYMRTDSVRIADEARSEARQYIMERHGQDYLPGKPRFYKSKKSAQDAHEAIRPTSVFRTPESINRSLTKDQLKIYQIIWARFLASQMASAVLDQTAVDVKAADYIFRANGSVIRFPGFMTLYIESREEGEGNGEGEAGRLPELRIAQKLDLEQLNPKQHFTEPPPRFSEASLVKKLEEAGIGRPSTYAPIIGTIQSRGYVLREGKVLKPTQLGRIINEKLIKHFPVIMGIEFTADMEDNLDRIVGGEIDYKKVLWDFYRPFERTLHLAEKEMKKVNMARETDIKCDKCGKPMVIKPGRYGDFMACSGFPECKNTRDISTDVVGEEKAPVCEKCGSTMILKRGRYGSFWACGNYPKCKSVKSIIRKTGVQCPKCGGDLIERKSKRGRIFYGCSSYPKCDFASWDKPLAEKCPQCGSLMVEHRVKNNVIARCSKEGCGYEKK